MKLTRLKQTKMGEISNPIYFAVSPRASPSEILLQRRVLQTILKIPCSKTAKEPNSKKHIVSTRVDGYIVNLTANTVTKEDSHPSF